MFMPCTTILVGKNASYDGSTMIARNDDSGSGHFTPKKFVVIHPEEQPKLYKSVLSHVEVPLPENPMRYTAIPNAVEGKGIWAASGVNSAHVAMTATETITSNPRVLGADPLVVYQPAEGEKQEIPGGIGEEADTVGYNYMKINGNLISIFYAYTDSMRQIVPFQQLDQTVLHINGGHPDNTKTLHSNRSRISGNYIIFH